MHGKLLFGAAFMHRKDLSLGHRMDQSVLMQDIIYCFLFGLEVLIPMVAGREEAVKTTFILT